MATTVLAVATILMIVISGGQCHKSQHDEDMLMFVKENTTINIHCPIDRANHSINYKWRLPDWNTARKDGRLHFDEEGRTLIVQNATIDDFGSYKCMLDSRNPNVQAWNTTYVFVYANDQCPMLKPSKIEESIYRTLNYISSPDGNLLSVQFPFYGNPGDLQSVEWFDSQNRSIANDPKYNTTVQRLDHQQWKYTVTFGKNTSNNDSFTLRVALYDRKCQVDATVTPRERTLPRVLMQHEIFQSFNQEPDFGCMCEISTYPADSTIEWQWSVCPLPHDGETWPIVERCVRTSTPDAIISTEQIDKSTQLSTFKFRANHTGIATCIATDSLGRKDRGFSIVYMINETAPRIEIEMGSVVRTVGSPLQLTLLFNRNDNIDFNIWSHNDDEFDNESERVQIISETLKEPQNTMRLTSLLNPKMKLEDMGVYECQTLGWDGVFTVYRWKVGESKEIINNFKH